MYSLGKVQNGSGLDAGLDLFLIPSSPPCISNDGESLRLRQQIDAKMLLTVPVL